MNRLVSLYMSRLRFSGIKRSGCQSNSAKATTRDCPVYLESQGKKWSPYIVITKELCLQCPFFNKQCRSRIWHKEIKDAPEGG